MLVNRLRLQLCVGACCFAAVLMLTEGQFCFPLDEKNRPECETFEQPVRFFNCAGTFSGQSGYKIWAEPLAEGLQNAVEYCKDRGFNNVGSYTDQRSCPPLRGGSTPGADFGTESQEWEVKLSDRTCNPQGPEGGFRTWATLECCNR